MAGLAYERRGKGEPLVLLHPLGSEWRVWEPVLDALARHHDVIALDLPGFGASAPLSSPPAPTPRLLARSVAEFLAALGVDRPHVVGNSLGGWVALELGLAGHARTVTALCPAGLWPRPLGPRRSVARRAAQLIAPFVSLIVRHRAGRRLVLGSTVVRPERVPPAAAARLVRAYARAPDFDAVNAAMRGGRFQALAEIQVPVTLAWGEHDRLIGRPAQVPKAVRQVVLAGCGHLPMWDDASQVVEVILEGTRPEPAAQGIADSIKRLA